MAGDNVVQFKKPTEARFAGIETATIDIVGGFGVPDMYGRGFFAHQIKMALDRASVMGDLKVLVLNINSPGGSESEMRDCLRHLENFKHQNPNIKIIGNITKQASSAALWLSTFCHHVHMMPNSIIGSLGIVGPEIDDDTTESHHIASTEGKAALHEDDIQRFNEEFPKLHAEFSSIVYASCVQRAQKNGIEVPAFEEIQALHNAITTERAKAKEMALEIAAWVNGRTPMELAALETTLSAKYGHVVDMCAARETIQEMARINGALPVNKPMEMTEKDIKQLQSKYMQRVTAAMIRENPRLSNFYRLYFLSSHFDAKQSTNLGLCDTTGDEGKFEQILQSQFGVTNAKPDTRYDISRALIIEEQVKLRVDFELEAQRQVQELQRRANPPQQHQLGAVHNNRRGMLAGLGLQ
jgi:hypothetical protein